MQSQTQQSGSIRLQVCEIVYIGHSLQVLEEMKKAEPHHGERWQRVSKDPANAHAQLETILKKVVVDMDNQPAP